MMPPTSNYKRALGLLLLHSPSLSDSRLLLSNSPWGDSAELQLKIHWRISVDGWAWMLFCFCFCFSWKSSNPPFFTSEPRILPSPLLLPLQGLYLLWYGTLFSVSWGNNDLLKQVIKFLCSLIEVSDSVALLKIRHRSPSISCLELILRVWGSISEKVLCSG